MSESRLLGPAAPTHQELRTAMASPCHRRVLLGIVVLTLAGFGFACDEKLSELAGPSPNLEPTFTSIQHEIFETTDASGRAACTNCHSDVGGRNPSGGLNLRHDVAYASIVNGASRGKTGAVRVIPGDAND